MYREDLGAELCQPLSAILRIPRIWNSHDFPEYHTYVLLRARLEAIDLEECNAGH